MTSIVEKIVHMQPSAAPLVEFSVQDKSDGLGPFIARWDESLGPQPTDGELKAVTQEQVDASKRDRQIEAAKARVDAIDPAIDVRFGVIHSEIEALKTQLANQVDGKPVEKVSPKTADEIIAAAKAELDAKL